MDLIEAIKTRKSIRGYKPDPVSKEILQEILKVAVQSPSAMNTQPWEVHVVAGDLLQTIGKENVEALMSGNAPSPDVSSQEKYQNEYKRRQVDLAKQLFQLMEIAREDQTARFEWMQRGFRYFEAPAAFLLTYDETLDPAYLSYFDLGGLTHAICLAALKHDLGTCIHGQGIMFPQVIRKHIDIPESKKIFMCISIGYPDWDFPANKVKSEREPVENIATWHGF
ncbi:MAG: nitroreductase [Proteobacteria bacterium]|nr:nitroreductase [Pseudomonadota bacterium]